MSCGKARGFTLIEALTACALIAMLGVLILQVVVPMARGTVRGTQQIELQQIAALAMDRLCIDLQSTAPAGAWAAPAQGNKPALVCLHPLRTIDSTGDQVWADQLIVYWWKPSEGKLWRTTWPHAGQTAPRMPTTEEPFRPFVDVEVLNIVDLTNDPYRKAIANQVKEFNVKLDVYPAELALKVAAPAPDSRPAESFTLTRKVSLRNERS